VRRYAEDRLDRLPELAAELVRLNVDVIMATGTLAPLAAKRATATIPIVMGSAGDPVGSGLVASLARPGGNVTGLSMMVPELGGNITGCFLDQPGLTGKWLELIGDTVPGARRITVLIDPTTGPWQLNAIKTAAAKRGIELQMLEVRGTEVLDLTLEGGLKGGSRALVQLSSPLFDTPFAKRIADFTVKHRLPAISMFRRFADSGGLMAYGPDQAEFYKRLSVYIDEILKGAKPADLPLEQLTKFELVINLKTAKALGLTIPQSVLGRADERIHP
jgi:ABC-type uncharacterized transport system substrate-binding protein